MPSKIRAYRIKLQLIVLGSLTIKQTNTSPTIHKILKKKKKYFFNSKSSFADIKISKYKNNLGGGKHPPPWD